MEKNRPEKRSRVFTTRLMRWNRERNTREMPWKGEKDPYRVWLSEIILQQTRVDQGLAYYNRFVKIFPNIRVLANAPEAKVFKLWEGLGYYTRCRNLMHTARSIAVDRKGVFPGNYEEILSLKGVGPYTAAAIASFAFDLPYAVVDGNVYRVLARIFGIDTATDMPAGKKIFAELADSLLDREQPGLYNQAMMDFGAVVCKPLAPLCGECPFRSTCFAFQNDLITDLPVKGKKPAIRKRWFYYIVLEYGNKIAIRKRLERDIWQDLYEFPLIERSRQSAHPTVLKEVLKKGWAFEMEMTLPVISPPFRQQLTHQLISGRFLEISLKKKPGDRDDWIWVSKKSIGKYPFPNYINQYLRGRKE